jgi:vacuolar-type H+-ATPase subunit H
VYVDTDLAQLIEVLHTQGVNKGREEGAGVVAEAQREAARILEETRKHAEEITEQAQSRSRETLAHLHQQMQLALRDLLLKAREELTELVALRPLRKETDRALTDPDFLKKVIAGMIEAYARSATSRESRHLSITVPEELKGSFVKEWLALARRDLDVPTTLHAEQGLHGFKIVREGGGGQLVVNSASIIDALRPFVSERFHALLDQEMRGEVDRV